MGGATEQQAGTEPVGGVPAPPGSAPKFHRGLDGKIYHYPPMQERLAALGDRFRKSIGPMTIMVTMPFAAIAFLVVIYTGLSLGGMIAAVMLITLVIALTLIVGIYFLIKNLFQGKLEIINNRTMHKLLYSDLPVLIADESSWQRVREQAGGVPQLNWLGIPALGKFEECLLFAASYLDVIEGFSNSPAPAKENKLRHGSCLYWLSSSPASCLGWITAGGCMLPWLNSLIWFMVFPLVVGANRYVELAGNVTAICDFFSANTDELKLENLRQADELRKRLYYGYSRTEHRKRPDPEHSTLADIQRRSGKPGQAE